jgi:hypothetical protein
MHFSLNLLAWPQFSEEDIVVDAFYRCVYKPFFLFALWFPDQVA